jgi:serine protease Do
MSLRRPLASRWRIRAPDGRKLGGLAAVVLGTLLMTPGGLAQEEAVRGFEAVQEQIRAVFEHCRSAVVKVEATDDHGRLCGTGFFIDPNGTLFTTYSVGGETRDISVLIAGRKHPAVRVVSDLRSGVAILKIEAETPFLVLGKSRDLSIATPVMTIGFPPDLPLSPSFGLVGGFDHKFQGRLFATTHIRANVATAGAQTGAPLMNLRGEAVGMVVGNPAPGASFVLPIEAAEKVRRDFLRFQQVRRGWLGLHVGGLDEPVDGSSAEVKDVLPDSPALKAGIRKGDVLLQVGSRRIASPEDVMDASFYLTATDEVSVRVSRGDEELTLTVQTTDYPDSLIQPLQSFAPGSVNTPDPQSRQIDTP